MSSDLRESKIEAFIERMRPYGITELVRSGRVALVRAGQHVSEEAFSTIQATE